MRFFDPDNPHLTAPLGHGIAAHLSRDAGITFLSLTKGWPNTGGAMSANGFAFGSGQTAGEVITPRPPEGAGVSSETAVGGSDRITALPVDGNGNLVIDGFGYPLPGSTPIEAMLSAQYEDANRLLASKPGTPLKAEPNPADWSFKGINVGPSGYGSRSDFLDAGASVSYLTRLCHGLAHDRGWWTDLETGQDMRPDRKDPLKQVRNIGEGLMLVVTELGEAMEGHRKGRQDDHLPHRSSLEVELGDAVIRIFDLAGGFNLDLGGAIAEKLAYNARRADHSLEARRADGGKKV